MNKNYKENFLIKIFFNLNKVLKINVFISNYNNIIIIFFFYLLENIVEYTTKFKFNNKFTSFHFSKIIKQQIKLNFKLKLSREQ